MRASQPESEPSGRMGRIALVGAGPGDPELLTLKAARAIAEADVILHDRLIGPDILLLAGKTTQLVDVGKRCGRHSMPQAEINALIVGHARAGAYVVRLKGGDPLIFGRGGEELEAARAVGIPCEIIPGITAACAAAASLSLPLTRRGLSSALHLVSGHGSESADLDHDWATLARPGATLVLYMGARRLAAITARMLAAGVPSTLPALAIESATMATERRIAGTVATIAPLVADATADGPTLLIFGETVAATTSRPGQRESVRGESAIAYEVGPPP
ncbi:MAG TPA: uroporphyrinogen-III C-methyltransferase [Alphaproteobacteria bacterium]|nr:uroporphyrinogen-III C-methyltransferase [Alphaproteobacteria bacterium]